MTADEIMEAWAACAREMMEILMDEWLTCEEQVTAAFEAAEKTMIRLNGRVKHGRAS